MKLYEIIAVVIALTLIALLVRTLVRDWEHMDAVSFALAGIVVVSSVAFVGFTFLYSQTP